MNLATLAQVKLWLQSQSATYNTQDDPLLSSMITSASGLITSITSRSNLLKKTITETVDGRGTCGVLLREWPVLSVSSVTIEGQLIRACQTQVDSGYVYNTWDGSMPGNQTSLELRGYRFCPGRKNVQIIYSAGYAITGEAQTVANAAATVSAPNGAWAQDDGVTYANGTALVKVASAPAQGQYALDATTPGAYVFNSGDNGEDVLISYSFIPSPLADACMAIVGERYRYKGRIGEVSRSIGGQTTASFSQKDVPDYVRLLLQQFSRVTPWP